MMVNPKKNIATCFSCGVGGNVISFVQKYENQVNHSSISLDEAITKVVEICHLNIDVSKLKRNMYDHQYTTSSRKYTEEQIKLLELNKNLNKLFNYNLVAMRGEALDYLHKRGVTDSIIKELSLGFAPQGQLLKISQNNEKFPASSLIKLGYLKRNKDGTLYETFQNRIMFPLYDEKGNIVSFSGRSVHDETPKYLHTIETDIFQKKELLYNFSDAKVLSYNNELILVEGYMDVIGAKKLGFENVAALMGVAISEEHLQLIKSNHSSVTLALDNDDVKNKEPLNDNTNENPDENNVSINAGKKAMLESIPRLLNEDFKVDVIDISKIGKYKDFGDLGNTDLKFMDIQKYKTTGFSYLLDNKYFKDVELGVENISTIYKTLKNDNIIKNTYDESLYKEYVIERSSFSKRELDEIIYPKKIVEKDNTIDNFATRAMTNFLFIEVNSQVEKKNDKVLTSYFDKYKGTIQTKLVEIFNNNPNLYLDATSAILKGELLLSEYLKENNDYDVYESLHRFKYTNVFDHAYVKNSNGSAKLQFDDIQRQQIIKQFEDSLSDQEKLALEEVEELYIINSIEDIDGILPYDHKMLNILRENIKDRMFLNKNRMDFFKFGSLFLNVDKDFIDNSFKGKTGNYKTILLYNNLDNNLKLDKKSLILEKKTEEVKAIPQEEIQDMIENKEFAFSINKVLLVSSFETDTHYFIRIPNTSAKEYMYIPKSECRWIDNQDLFYSSLKYDRLYPIYNKQGEYICDKTVEELKQKLDDKTKSEITPNFPEEIIAQAEQELIFDNSYTSRYKEPICKVYKSKIYLETEKGFYIKTDNPSTLIFAIKKICDWNEDGNYLIVSPRRGIFNTGISKYNLKGFKKTFEQKLSYQEINKYLKIFYPNERKKRELLTLSIPKFNCEFNSNFIKIPLIIDNVLGCISVNIIKSKIDNDNVCIELSKDEQIGFHNKDGIYIKHYDGMKIVNSYKEMIKENDKEIEDFNILMCEKEAV